MKKIVRSIAIASIILSFSSSSIFALEEKTELNTKQYVNTLKQHIKKEKFDEIKTLGGLNIINHIKVSKKGMDLGYIEPTIDKIVVNIEKTKELITFLENNNSPDEKINTVSNEMLDTLNEMLVDLENSHVEYSQQIGFDISDDDKKSNLSGSLHPFSEKTFAYDYINHYNDRVEKIEKMYKYIKDIS